MYYSIVSAEYAGGYCLKVAFEDGTAGVIDLTPYTRRGGVFRKLAQPSFFAGGEGEGLPAEAGLAQAGPPEPCGWQAIERGESPASGARARRNEHDETGKDGSFVVRLSRYSGEPQAAGEGTPALSTGTGVATE